MARLRALLPVLLLISGCKELTHRDRVVVLQPLGAFSGKDVTRVQQELRQQFGTVLVRKPLPLPSAAYYEPRGRYRADSLLRTLADSGSADTVIVGLLNEDISTTKGGHADWGVMGLGYRPGNACVASTFRVNASKRSAQFYKVVIHELGHTQGLPHCPEKTCFMRDADGGNPLEDEHRFCESCSRFLKSKGWKLD